MNLATRINGFSKVGYCLLFAVLFLWLCVPQTASAGAREDLEKYWIGAYGNIDASQFRDGCNVKFGRKVLAKAKPDECFQGVGNPGNFASFQANYPGDLTLEEQAECLAIQPPAEYETPNGHAQPKVNQAYVWGLTKYWDKLFFGTISNVHCLVISGYLESQEPSINSSWVCEGGRAASGFGDFRPPRAFYYDLKKKELVELTTRILEKSPVDAALLQSTVGLRSAGAARGVVFLGGIGRAGVNVFAFNGQTGDYLGAISFNGQNGRPLYTNVRQWRLVKNDLYVGVGKPAGGEILRWTGKLSADPAELFVFEKVGEIGGDPAYVTPHEDRLFVSTWPAGIETGGAAQMSIWMSPKLGKDCKLTSADATLWRSVWKISDYEPEESLVATTGGGAIMSYQGYLYWGTMHVPGLSLLSWNQDPDNAGASDEDRGAALLGTYRPISIFRGKNFDIPCKKKVEVLYGNSQLPRYTSEGGWEIVPNNMGQTPKYGLAGFNNFFNNYTWWMEVFKGQLFVGTMDFLYLGAAGIRDEYTFPEKLTKTFEKFYGADLWRFPSSCKSATPVSLSGVGNYSSYGVRTMVSADALYLGMANPMNLMTDLSDNKPEGGWELLKLNAYDQSVKK
jgi:hypothetical protein